jgi:quinol monooxygenase YgiN
MIVYYVSFEVDTDDRAGFDQWYRARTKDAKQEKGCLAFDYLVDPEQPRRGFMVEIWETAEDLEAHMAHPRHVEALALGSMKWGLRDVHVHVWTRAEGHEFAVRNRTDDLAEGHGALSERIEEFQKAYRPAGEV